MKSRIERDSSIDVLRGIAIIMVLAIHASFPFQGQALQVLQILQAFSAPAVLIFFFCSGYCLPSRCSKRLSLSSFSPILRLVTAFFFWSLLSSFLAWIICTISSACPWITIRQQLFTFDLDGIPGSRISFQLYFLAAMAVIRLLDLIFYQWRILGRFSFSGVHIILAILALIVVGLPPEWHGPYWSNFVIYLFSFGIGRISKEFNLSSLHEKASNFISGLPFELNKLLWIPSLFIVFVLFWNPDPSLTGLILLPCYFPAAFLLCRQSKEYSSTVYQLLGVVGMLSGGVFLLHAPFLSSVLFKAYNLAFPVNLFFSPLVYILLLLIASAGLLVVCRSFLPRSLFKWLLLTDDLLPAPLRRWSGTRL
jgi:peptidoglycan/LPS O-acetylase OafA/YrhL